MSLQINVFDGPFQDGSSSRVVEIVTAGTTLQIEAAMVGDSLDLKAIENVESGDTMLELGCSAISPT